MLQCSLMVLIIRCFHRYDAPSFYDQQNIISRGLHCNANYAVSDNGLGSHPLSYVDASLFTQGILFDAQAGNVAWNAGGQVNFVFNHWFNLESTFSVGAAQAWSALGASQELFVSFKLLKN